MKHEVLVLRAADRPPEPGQLIGTPVNLDGDKGVVVSNTQLTISVRWNSWLTYFKRRLRRDAVWK